MVNRQISAMNNEFVHIFIKKVLDIKLNFAQLQIVFGYSQKISEYLHEILHATPNKLFKETF